MSRLPIALVIVFYKGLDDLQNLLNSVTEQTFLPEELVIVDNSLMLDKQVLLRSERFEFKIIKPQKNLGFCKGNNIGIETTAAPYLFFCNPDIILHSRTLEILYSFLKKDDKIAAVGPKLLRFGNSNVIDSAGIELKRNRQFKNFGEGEKDRSYFNIRRQIFGLCAAALLIKRLSLSDIAIMVDEKKEFFDEDFFAYKDDIDLAYRLRHRGWKLFYVPEAIVYHKRRIQEFNGGVFKNTSNALFDQKKLRLRSLSWRNHIFVLIKNEPVLRLIKNSPWIMWFQFKKFIFLLFFYHTFLREIKQLILLFPKMIKKRKQIFQKSVLKARKISDL